MCKEKQVYGFIWVVRWLGGEFMKKYVVLGELVVSLLGLVGGLAFFIVG